MSTKIFLSVGRTSTDQQEAFVQAIEHHLESHGLIPQTVGRTYFSSQQPLKAIDELMQQCDGTVIVAYERLYADQLTDRRGHPEEKVLGPAHFPTVWWRYCSGTDGWTS